MTVQAEVAPPVVARVPPLRHLFYSPRAPVAGDRAVCGAVLSGRGARRNPGVSRDHCVVCVELAMAMGWRP
jgi:hypothetical protein